jgi:hypothetical protein
MARLLLFLLAGAAVWYGWRMFRRQQARVTRDLRDAESTLAKEGTVELRRDPKTGVYRPSDRRD